MAASETQWIASTVYERDSVQNQAQELGSNWVRGLSAGCRRAPAGPAAHHLRRRSPGRGRQVLWRRPAHHCHAAAPAAGRCPQAPARRCWRPPLNRIRICHMIAIKKVAAGALCACAGIVFMLHLPGRCCHPALDGASGARCGWSKPRHPHGGCAGGLRWRQPPATCGKIWPGQRRGADGIKGVKAVRRAGRRPPWTKTPWAKPGPTWALALKPGPTTMRCAIRCAR